MADVNVNYESMENAAQRLSAGQEEITSQLSALKAMVDELVDNGFVTDVASGSFHESYTEFNTSITQAIEALDAMSRYLNSTVSTFRDADSSSRVSFG
jgi:WXG100 family type VII secretion target